MDIDDLEKNLGNIRVNTDKVAEQSWYLTLENNSLLWAILENQIHIYAKLDPTTPHEEHRIRILSRYEEIHREAHARMMNKVADK